MLYFCCDERRRTAVRAHPTLNGIDFLDVLDGSNVREDQRQRRLFVHFIKPLEDYVLTPKNVFIEGGERIRDVAITKVEVGKGAQSHLLIVEVNKPGDFSTYTLRLAQDAQDSSRFDRLLSAIDFSFKAECDNDTDCQPGNTCPPEVQSMPEIDYLAKDYNSFRQLMLDRMTALMPQWQERSVADVGVALIELLAYAGDYLSYQQDVIGTEAYLGTARRRASVRRHARLIDYFINDGSNARAWVQVLVSNDIVKEKPTDPSPLPKGTQLLTRVPGWEVRIPSVEALVYDQSQAAQPEIFETIYAVDELYEEHNELSFYTWGARECCLAAGATHVTLRGNLPNLKEGNILIFKERLGPRTGQPEDADPAHRHIVRLTKITHTKDPLGKLFIPTSTGIITSAVSGTGHVGMPSIAPAEVESTHQERVTPADMGEYEMKKAGRVAKGTKKERSKPRKRGTTEDTDVEKLEALMVEDTKDESEIVGVVDVEIIQVKEKKEEHKDDKSKDIDYSIDVTEIEWHVEDALPFPLCISVRTDFEHGQQYIENVSVALGNIVLADHGHAVPSEPLGSVPPVTLYRVPASNGDRCQEIRPKPVPPRFRPQLKFGPLTQAAPYIEHNPPLSASAVMQWAVEDILPMITLEGIPPGSSTSTWHPRRDLLNSDPSSTDFVVENEADGTTYLRFGDGQHGLRPLPCTAFMASYRVGNGVVGNVGAEVLAHIVSSNPNIVGVSNPLPARGGVEPENVENVRQQAPGALRTQGRAVTAGDYIEVAERHPGIHQAVADIRWTGAWLTVFLNAERVGRAPVDQAFKDEMLRYMEQFRMGGYDIEIGGPRYVSLEVAMTVVVKPDYFRGDVKTVLLDTFSSRVLLGGRLGLFHPDNFLFGQPVYLSPLYAAAMSVEGVAAVQVTKFQRQDCIGPDGLTNGRLIMRRIEIARLDNDPNYPEHGIFRLRLEDGK